MESLLFAVAKLPSNLGNIFLFRASVMNSSQSRSLEKGEESRWNNIHRNLLSPFYIGLCPPHVKITMSINPGFEQSLTGMYS